MNRLGMIILLITVLGGCSSGLPFVVATEAPPTEVVTAAPEGGVQPTPAAPSGLQQIFYSELGDFSLLLPLDWIRVEQEASAERQVLQFGPADSIGQLGASGIVIIATQTAEAAAAQLTCADCPAPTLQQAQIDERIAAQTAAIDEGIGLPSQWYFVEHGAQLISFSFRDPIDRRPLRAISDSFSRGRLADSGDEANVAAQVARQALADDLALNPYAVAIESVRPAAWNDSCYGVYRLDVSCSEQSGGGYSITLSVDDEIYQAHSSIDGSVLIWLPTQGTASGSLALVTLSGSLCRVVVIAADGVVQRGGCDNVLSQESIGDAGRSTVDELGLLLTTVAPFHAQFEYGLLNFNGAGSRVADAAERERIGQLVAGIGGVDQLASSVPAIVWRREGGVAGFCDTMAVFSDGRVVINSCKSVQPRESRLSEAQIAQLNGWRQTLSDFELASVDSDRMTTTLAFKGEGAAAGSDAEQQAVHDFTRQLFAEAGGAEQAGNATAAVDHGLETPGEVVEQFLLALIREPSGRLAADFLNSALKERVLRGEITLQALLGIGESFPSFTYLVRDSGLNGTAAVAATLNNSPAVNLTIELTQESGRWYISDVRR